MAKKDPRVDAYIEKSAAFARPILEHIRALVHAAVPDVEEAMKWSFPHFMYKGMLCSMAAFKSHCAFGFWKASLLFEGKTERDAMGHFGRIASRADLPSDKTLTALIKKAARLNDEGVKVERKPVAPAGPVDVPAYVKAALRKNKQAADAFKNFSNSHRREYVEWITEAKTEATRQKRLETAVTWIAEGKRRHWKYVAR
jgi:uncharacterized protein YdeI (YjbR/CyaY-like superfamily)